MPTDTRSAPLVPAKSTRVPNGRRHRLPGLAWLGPIIAALIGGALRLWHLGTPNAFVFDETYYAKDALGLIRFGTEQAVVSDANELLLAHPGAVAAAEIFTGNPSFVVHPPIGKWLIGLGELGFGVDPFGWRIAAVLASTLSILILGRVVVRLTGNALLGTIAAGLLALDGVHIVLGRTALLDGFLMLFVLIAFACLLIDRDRARQIYGVSGPPRGLRWRRPWRFGAGVALGLACGVKWSALWYVGAFVVLALVWEVGARRSAGSPRVWRRTLLTDSVPLGITLVGVGFLVYFASWTGWLITDDGWSRWWDPQQGSLLPQPLAALWHYHAEIYQFHIHLSSPHPYQSSPWGWLLQARPTSFFYSGDGTACGADKCSQAVTSLGNPFLWWGGIAALIHQVYRSVFVRDWRSSAIVVAVFAGWVPWLLYPERTMFTFYSVVFVPFLVAAITLSLGQLLGTGPVNARSWRVAAVGAYLLVIVVSAWWFYPIWTGEEISYQEWHQRMWFAPWI